MSLNKSEAKLPDDDGIENLAVGSISTTQAPQPVKRQITSQAKTQTVNFQNPVPNYAELVKFLVSPFLETPGSLRVDCEGVPGKSRVWIRLAFESSDKGRVFGRGGRNIQAIRMVLEAAAQVVGQTAYLDVYGSQPTLQNTEDLEKVSEKPSPRRSSSAKSSPKLRTD